MVNPTYTDLQKIYHQAKSNAQSFLSTLGGGANHHLGLIISDMSCSSPKWDNLSSGHQLSTLLGLFGKVHVLGSKTIL